MKTLTSNGSRWGPGKTHIYLTSTNETLCGMKPYGDIDKIPKSVTCSKCTKKMNKGRM